MRLLIAPASFKGCLECTKIADIIADSCKRYHIKITKAPISDGGDGFLYSVSQFMKIKIIKTVVTGPLWDSVRSRFGFCQKTKTTFIQMSEASGLKLVPLKKRNPLIATTYGTGELILKAVDYGAKKIVIGAGGSATVDGGIGALSAMGIKFLSKDGRQLFFPKDLYKLQAIDTSAESDKMRQCKVIIATDVSNYLLGKNGAARVFGPQKGASPADIEILEKGLLRLSEIVKNQFNVDVASIRGGGAAGGLVASLAAFMNARVVDGADFIFKIAKIRTLIRNSSLVITGEGCFDRTSLSGKATYKLIKLCRRYKTPCVIICGRYALSRKIPGLLDVKEITRIANKNDAIKNAPFYIRKLTQQILEEFLSDNSLDERKRSRR